jgi:GNAT superfamily N-acetyltransferase
MATGNTASAGDSSRCVFTELDGTPSSLAVLAQFYHTLYVGEFPDPHERESLANMKRYLRLKGVGFYGPNNYHIVVASVAGEWVGGAVIDYLAVPNVGIIEFLFINAQRRGHGLGKALLDHVGRLLEQDARASLGRRLAAIVAEMNDPYRRPEAADNLDPFGRAAIWGKWGYCKIDFPYVQPALSRMQRPVRCLALIMRPLQRRPPRDVAADWVQSIVGEYMRWAMRIPRLSGNREYRAMAQHLSAASQVPLVPLEAYIGRDPARPFVVRPMGSDDVLLKPLLALLRREIPVRGRVASAAQFQAAFATRPGHTYHLWQLRAPGARRAEGLASFFTLPEIGFGGYIVLAGALRGRGLLRQLVARIEEQMMRDNSRVEAWMIECGDESVKPFARVGFVEIPVAYFPPAVGVTARATSRTQHERLHLLYKPFGSTYGGEAPSAQVVLGSVASILRGVYDVRSPRRHACYRQVAHSFCSSANR